MMRVGGHRSFQRRAKKRVAREHYGWCPGGTFGHSTTDRTEALFARAEAAMSKSRRRDYTRSWGDVTTSATQRVQRAFVRCVVCGRRLHPKPLFNAFEADLSTFVVPAHKAK